MKKSTDYIGDMVTLPLAGKPTGERLRIIRQKLNDMYNGEFTIKKVAEQCGLTYHGLRKLETGDSEPRKSTVLVLADFYNVPLNSLYPRDDVKFELDYTFFLGKKEEMLLYFDDQIEEWGQPHMLDPRREFPPHFDDSNVQEIEYENNGRPSLEDISIEVTLKVFQNKTNTMVLEKSINERAPISADEIDVIQNLIQQQVKVLSDYHVKLKQAKEQL
ncbi:helix-turn-helix domain-containing protein [Paenibacillus ihuae]|uniref:helix-turn-helix domain-containing protein n=1 Tax=Paenibacillus ihuae TaxID=1232431 RepID=UPI0006D5B4BC|nr:helix-turn-helix transcriptional regulator [Paenibacillus ihuae]